MATTPESETTGDLSKSDVRYWAQRLFKHSRQARGQRYSDKDWSVRIAYQGRRDFFQLGLASKYEAARKARAIYQRLVAVGWEATLAEFKPAKAAKTPKSNATVGAFLSELTALRASKAKTIEGYAVALRKIVADLAGIESGGRGGKADKHRTWRERVESTPLSILTPARIQTWKETFLARAGFDPLKQRAARVSVNSFLRRARSLFGPGMTQGLDNIVLPAPLPFSGIKLEKRSMPKYQSGFDVMSLIKAAREELAEPEPEQFKIFVLAVMAGLRRNEIDKLQWDSINWHAGTIAIAPTEYFRTKTDDSARSIWVPSEMLELFRGYRAKASGRFVIESYVAPRPEKPYDHYRCATLFEKLIGWLRSAGVGGQRPLHTLRKEFGSLIAQSYRIHAVAAAI